MEKERVAEHEDPDKLYAQELSDDEDKVKKPKGKSKGKGKGKGKGGRGRGSKGRGRGKPASIDQDKCTDAPTTSEPCEPSAASGVGSGEGAGEKRALPEEVIHIDESKVASPKKRIPKAKASPKATATRSRKRAVLQRAKSQSPGKRMKLDSENNEEAGDSKVPE